MASFQEPVPGAKAEVVGADGIGVSLGVIALGDAEELIRPRVLQKDRKTRAASPLSTKRRGAFYLFVMRGRGR